MDLSIENIEKAVLEFYAAVDPANQREINQWLMTAQVSPQAWAFSGQLLAKEKRVEVQFFGANTLHLKIARFWHELPPDQMQSLRMQLMEHISNFASGPKMILTRTCVALAAFAMHSIPELWPDAINDIFATYQNAKHLESDQKLTILLEILTVLPEEFHTAFINNYRKGIMRNELQKSIPQVLSLLNGLLESESAPLIYEQALRCLSSWVMFGIPLNESHCVIEKVFHALKSDAFFESAIETLVNLFNHPENSRFPASVKHFLAPLIQLQPMLQNAKETCDVDMCQGLVKLIVAAAGQNTRLLLTMTLSTEERDRQIALGMVNLILQCTAMPGFYPVDECCSDIPFYFWYNFQDDIIATDGETQRLLTQLYTPLYMQLVNVLLEKAQCPPDAEYATWLADEKEAHRCYRQDIADTLMYAYNFLHEPLLGNLCVLFQQVIEKPEADIKWQEIEAVLFAVTSIAESVDLDEFIYLPALFNLLARVPCTNQQVVSQALFLIGAYAEWISNHSAILESVIPLVLQGLKNEELSHAATMSLLDLLQENQPHIYPFIDDIITASKAGLENNCVKGREAIRLMSCLGYVLSVLPVTEIMNYLDILLTPHIRELQEAGNQQPTPSTKAVIQHKLNMLCWLFKTLNVYWGEEEEGGRNRANSSEPQPVLLVLQKLLPILPGVLQAWIQDDCIVESLCDMIKKAIRTLMEEYAPLVNDSVTLITQLFEAHPHYSLLDLGKQILILFAADEKFRSANETLFISLATKSLTSLQANVHLNPDLMDNFMTFLAHLAKKNCQLFDHPQCNLTGIFQAGVIGLGMPESNTVKAACQFLCDFVMCGEKVHKVKEIITNQGHILIDKLMRAIGGESPRAVVDSMSDVFLALNKQHSEELCRWMNDMVAHEGFPCARATHQEKEQFARKVIKERVSKKRLKETVQEYTLLWRGLLGTEYAAQTLNPIA